MTNQSALLVLNAIPQMASSRIRRFVQECGEPLQVLEKYPEIIKFSKDKFFEDEYNLMRQKGVRFLTFLDEDFPCSLKNLPDGPVLLYIKGDASCLHQKSVAIVGSRSASHYGQQISKSFARSFAQAGLVVVSGLARGIDTLAHQGCLEAQGQTVAVMGSGFNDVYPRENRDLLEKISEQGVAVSEFPMNRPPLKFNFPWRNRIITGLSLATVVIEAGEKSGALISADYAVTQGRDVFVVPGNIDHPCAVGSNRLIQDGARIVLEAQDVIREIQSESVVAVEEIQLEFSDLNENEDLVFKQIHLQPIHMDDLLEISGLEISRLMEIVLSLELKRLIRSLPGQYYIRNTHG